MKTKFFWYALLILFFLATALCAYFKHIFILSVLVVLFSFLFFYRTGNSLSEIIKFSQKISGGDLSRRLKITQKDELGELAVSLNKMADSLERVRHLENLRREFVANVSHEFKTPLTSIVGYTETMLNTHSLDEQEQRFLKKIAKNAAMLTTLVEEVLQLSHIESGTFRIQPETRDINILLGEVVSDFNEKIKHKERHLTITFDKPENKMSVDVQVFKQILSNLIDNAIKYTDQDGRIAISTASDENQVTVAIEDNGIGIPKKDQERIFERFYRVDKSRSRHVDGTGLGLSIVKHLTQAHEAEIKVKSELGAGSLFSVTFKRTLNKNPTC